MLDIYEDIHGLNIKAGFEGQGVYGVTVERGSVVTNEQLAALLFALADMLTEDFRFEDHLD